MTKVAARFAAPWGHHDPQKLREDLVEAGRQRCSSAFLRG